MLDIIHHRGPDHQGFFTSNTVVLGNARLSIMDPRPQANLPFVSPDGKVVLCYNGEVTNYLELKQKYRLTEKYHFKTNSDTEVLLYLYLEKGIAALNELTGMFALCIYDETKNKVFLARDFFGIIPLFYYQMGDAVYFCSEIKGLLEIPGFEKKVNQQAIFDFLTLAYVPGEDTAFENIFEVRNGQLLTFDIETKKNTKQYFYRMHYNVNRDIPFDEAKKNVHDLLSSSVERNLRADVPTGVTLSGGVDTSGIVSLANELGLSKGLHTFSIRMGEESFDESTFQQLVSRECGTIHHEYLITPQEVLNNFDQHLAHLDEPLGDGASIPFFILASHAKKEVKVLVNGEGGDEVFNAYSIYQAWKARNLYVNYCPRFMRQLLSGVAHLLPSDYSKISFDFMAKRFTEGAELHPAAAHIYWRHPFTNSEKQKLFKNRAFRSTDDVVIGLYDQYQHTDELNRVSMLDFEHFLTDDLLLKNDRMMIAHSIEGRFPYLDRELIDYTQTLPPSYKLKGFQGRYIQKKALQHILPQKILNRPNYGLEMPHSLWFFEGLRPLVTRYLTEENVRRFDYLDWPSLREMMSLHFSKKRDYGRGLWCVINFLAWHEMFIETDNYRKHLVRS